MIGGLAVGTLGYTGIGGGRPRPPAERTTPVPEETPSVIVRYQEPQQVLDTTKQYFAVLKTSGGEIRIELFADKAPQAVNSFIFLAQEEFYRGLTFFFVKQGFVAQAGDPTCDAVGQGACTGTGGPGYTLEVEGTSGSHEVGALVLPVLPEGDKVHGSQFRILLADDRRLDGKETVFGRVISGLEVLTALPERIPCFGQEPSATNPCQVDPLPGLAIEDVVIETI